MKIGKNGMMKLRFPVSSVSAEEFDKELKDVGAEVFPFCLFLGAKKQWCIATDYLTFLREIKVSAKSKSLNTSSPIPVRKRDNEYYYFNNDVVVMTKVK